jgi:adenylate cyclase
MRRWLIGLLLGLLVGMAGLLLDSSPLGVAFEQSVGLGVLFKTRGAVQAPGDVVVVAIDGRSGEQLGLPSLPREWPRSIHGELVDALARRGASVIAFDVHFGRPKDPETDQVFIDAAKRAGNVVLVELLTGKRRPIADQTGRHVGTVWEEEAVPPFAELADAAAALASFPLPKEGASVYQLWVFKESADEAPTLPAVVLQIHARDALEELLERIRSEAPDAVDDLPRVEDTFANSAQLRLLMRGLRMIFEGLPDLWDGFEAQPSGPSADAVPALAAMYAGDAHRFINFYGPPGTITTVPYHAVLGIEDPNVPPEALDLEGKVVFVGYSDLFDPGQPDRFHTVFTRDDGVDLSGVEIAATTFANLLTDRALAQIDHLGAVLLLLLFSLALGVLAYALPVYVGVPAVLILIAAYAALAYRMFAEHALILPVATPLLVLAPIGLFAGLLGQYLLERRRGQRISEAINYYLPDEIVRDLVQNRLEPGKLNQVVYGTCLATDMAGFSTVAETLPPAELAKFLNDYFETLAAPLKKHGVHVTEFRADAIMCAWVADKPSPDPRRKALLAALDAGEAIKDFRQRHDMPGARLRIGLEAGYVYVGHAGGGGRFVYSIVGDSANTASRVEGLNKHVGTQILATGEVVAGFENLVMRSLGAFQFVGKTDAIPVYEVLAKRETATEAQMHLCEVFESALAVYQDARWSEAAERFKTILEVFRDDGPSHFYLERCRRMLAEPGQGEDPRVIRMDAK